MAVTREDVEHMATLARLKLDMDTAERFARQFSDILRYMDTLNSVDTDGITPLYHPLGESGALRADKSTRECSPEEVTANAPQAENNYFVVPRIV